MDQIDVNATRPDPYRNYRIRIRWDGRHVAGISRMSALKRTTEVVEHREGGDPGPSRLSPGRTSSEPITLERGVTHDLDFEEWANAVPLAGAGAANTAFRKDISIDLYNEAGQRTITYRVYRCWVSAFQVLPDLDANAQAVAIESITLQNEGWERLPPPATGDTT